MVREPRPRKKVRDHKERWLILRVVLRGRGDEVLDPAPGRDLLVSGRHTFAQLARAIDRAFARCDRGSSHLFYLGDGRRLGEPSDEWVMPNWAGGLRDALPALAALGEDDLAGAPASVAAWSLAAKLALDLVCRELVPRVRRTPVGATEARWGVAPLARRRCGERPAAAPGRRG